MHTESTLWRAYANALRLPQLEGNMATTIILGLFATVGVGALALISYLFYLSHGSRDRLK